MELSDRRPDVDIEEEIGHLVRSFAPLKASRPYFNFQSVNGYVTIVGNVRNPQARRVLTDNVPRIAGVIHCDTNRLYDDEMIRFAVGQLLPPGVYVSVQYGVVALTGRLSEGVSQEAILNEIQAVSGVRRVGSELGAPESSSSVK